MADWTLAPTLSVLRSEINKRWPNRDKTSDGSLGNATHAAGTSDHNPDARGVVCAIDIDEDLYGPTDPSPSFHSGTPAAELVRELIANAKAGLTPQLFYVIYERRIYSRTYGWISKLYTGPNPHDHHVHVSVYHPAKFADSTSSWGIHVALSKEDIDKVADAVVKRLLFTDNLPAPAMSPTIATNDTWKGISFWQEAYNAARRVEEAQKG